MRSNHFAVLVTVASLFPLLTAAVEPPVAPAGSTSRAVGGTSREAEVARALSAAPPPIAAGAAVVRMDEKGGVTPLREGHNGWTCMPRDPGTPTGHPVCLDRDGLAWYEALMSGRNPAPEKIGYSYMLQGGSSWSNVDPLATAVPAGEKTYVSLPPHLMILSADVAARSHFPAGQPRPDTHAPFVMYAGTPYAIVIIPVK